MIISVPMMRKQMYSDVNNMRASADSRILRGYSIDDIDMPTLHQYRRAYDIKHENHLWTEVDDKQFWENIGAYRKDRATSTEGFTVAGMLMFGQTNSITDPEYCQEFFPDYREHLSDDPQIRWTNRIYPDGTWEANLYQFFTRVLPLLQHALPVPFSLDNNQMRNNTTTAHVALREAFANSLIHAAYTVRGNIVIDRYFDRIVLSNPGTMLVSMEEYYEGGHSVCRNPVIQKMFVFLGIGEKGGTGADVIAKGWKDNGWSIPTVEEKNNPDIIETCLSLVNRTNKTTETAIATTETPVATTETSSYTTETTTESPSKTTETTTETIIGSIRNNPKITTKEIAAVCGITEDGVAYHIKKLKQIGKLIRIGGSRNGGDWKVAEQVYVEIKNSKNMLLGNKIRSLKDEQGILQRQVAAYLEIDTPMFSKIERGDRRAKRSQVIQMATYFKVDEKEMLTIWLADKILDALDGEDELKITAIETAKSELMDVNR